MYIDALGHELETSWLGDVSTGPPLVFLHEGLGSIELWRDFPSEVVKRTGSAGLVYSRHGHGNSSVLAAPRTPEFMHIEALESLPGLVDDLVGRPPILIGHSDGASIALIYAGSGYPVEGLVLIAPHVMVEERGLEAIRRIETEFEHGDLRSRMSRYHRDPGLTFTEWADVWLSSEFRSWDITDLLPTIAAPTLLIQSEDDDYGTLSHIELIEAKSAGSTTRVVVPGSSHAPHLTSPERITAATTDFILGLR